MDKEKLDELNADVYEKGRVDREHLLCFLTLVPTNDGLQVANAVRSWLEDLHNDPKYDKVHFPAGDIDAIITDLTSYGRLQPDTLHDLQQNGSYREFTV